MDKEILSYLIPATLGVAGYIAAKLIGETHKNTMAIVELTVQMKHLAEKLSGISKLEKDVHALHEWRRGFNGNGKEADE